MKYFLIIFIFLSVSGCGVTTDSSKSTQSSGNGTGTGTGTGSTGNTNNSGNANNSGATDSNTSGAGTMQEPAFDTSGGAVLDPNACRSAYATAVPLQDSADDASQRETTDTLNGVSLMSLYPKTFVANDSNVIAFYKLLPVGTALTDKTQRQNVYGDNSRFILVYDLAWVTTPNNIVYIQTPKLTNKLNSCYRVKLDSVDGSSLTPVKVYSYKQ